MINPAIQCVPKIPTMPSNTISLYDWYKDAKGRIWCVTRIWTDGKTTTVDILEVGKCNIVNQPEAVLLGLVQSGAFKKYVIR